MNPEGELRFEDPGDLMEFLEMGEREMADEFAYVEPEHRGLLVEAAAAAAAAGGPPAPPPGPQSAAGARPSVWNNFIDDYKLADVLKRNGLPRLRVFVVGVLGRSRTKVSLTETRYDSVAFRTKGKGRGDCTIHLSFTASTS